MTATPRPSRIQTLDPRRSWTGFLLSAGVGLIALFWLLRPDVSAPLGPGARALFWTLHIALPLMLAQTAQLGVQRVRGLARMPGWAQIGLAGMLAAVLFAPVAVWADRMFALPEDPEEIAGGLVGILFGEVTGLAPSVVLVWVALNGARHLRLAPTHAAGQAETPPHLPPVRAASDIPRPAFWDRVPPDLGTDLVALSAELHYLRVYTTRGDTLVLAGFGQAVEELAQTPLRGMRVHRSHWVALDHVTAVSRRGQAAQARLSTGLILPVSRAYKTSLTDALEPGSLV